MAALAIFIVEALLKMNASSPRVVGYFRDGWNVFDFLVIVFALIPATSELAMIARLARLLRVLRFVSTIKDLRLIVTALIRSIPSVGHVMLLMSIIVYIYAIIGYHLFSEHDPENWRNLGISVLTLFNIITLEGWIEVMFTAMELHPLAWVYFVTFVVIGTLVVINLFIAIIINNLDEAKLERIRDLETPCRERNSCAKSAQPKTPSNASNAALTEIEQEHSRAQCKSTIATGLELTPPPRTPRARPTPSRLLNRHGIRRNVIDPKKQLTVRLIY